MQHLSILLTARHGIPCWAIWRTSMISFGRANQCKHCYIRLRRLDSDRKNWASIRSFVVVPAGAASLEFEILRLEQAMFFLRSTISLVHLSRIQVLFHSRFQVVWLLTPSCFHCQRVVLFAFASMISATSWRLNFTSNEPFFTVDVAKKVTRMELIGKAEVFEIIPKK